VKLIKKDWKFDCYDLKVLGKHWYCRRESDPAHVDGGTWEWADMTPFKEAQGASTRGTESNASLPAQLQKQR
jgi:hypothetical protein